jgi:hypothetical protein
LTDGLYICLFEGKNDTQPTQDDVISLFGGHH